MWLCPALLLFSLPGCLSIIALKTVRGREQGSLTVQCHYTSGWQNYGKYWCRGPWKTCRTLVATTGSEQEVRKGRVSIRDDHKKQVFHVTMKELRQSDAGLYWCGIQKSGNDLWARVTVDIEPAGLHTSTSLLSQDMVSNQSGMRSGLHPRTHYMLLVFVKVPILLAVVGVVFWLKGPQGNPKEQCEEPFYVNSSFSLLIQDTVPQKEG